MGKPQNNKYRPRKRTKRSKLSQALALRREREKKERGDIFTR